MKNKTIILKTKNNEIKEYNIDINELSNILKEKGYYRISSFIRN